MGNETHENLFTQKNFNTNNKHNEVFIYTRMCSTGILQLQKEEWILNVCYLLGAMPASKQLLKEIMKHRNESDPHLNKHI